MSPRRASARTLAALLAVATVLTAGATSSIRIRAGDTLWAIAHRHHTTVDVLRRLNDLPGDGITIGEVLRVPGGAGGGGGGAAERGYTVRPGDTLSAIAARFGVSVATVARRNRISARSLLLVGRRLAIPLPARGSSNVLYNGGVRISDPVLRAAAADRAYLAGRPQPSSWAVHALITRTARRLRVDPALALAVAWNESGFQQQVVSPVDAIGIMQVLPSTGRLLGYAAGRRLDLFRAEDNVYAGVLLLSELVRATGRTDLALAGYYQGLGSIHAHGLLPQTHDYIRTVSSLRAQFQTRLTAAHLDWAAVDAPVEADTDPLVGRLLDGRYRLDRLLARGGMATVYVGTDSRLDRVVAVKVMRPALAEDPDFVARFAREARAAARLSSPEVVAVYDQGKDAATGTAYLVMEYVAGRTLRDVLRAAAPLSPGRALELLEPVLRALAAAHTAGLVHRDIKPENVLLGDDGRVKVADFGLARAVATSNLTATTGLLIGTVAYLAPEQVEHGAADPRTDVYAAGILLWEMLTGSPPYGGESPLSVAYRHVHDDVPAPSSVVAGVPAAIDGLAVRATRRDPEARPADGAAFLAEVLALRATLPAPALDAAPTLVVPRPTTDTLAVPRPAPPAGTGAAALALDAEPAPAGQHRRRRAGLIGGGLVLLLALVALLGGWYLGSGRYTRTPSVLNLTRAAALQTLSHAGLKPVVDPGRVFSETVPVGAVSAQRPAPHDRVRRGGTVTIVLSKGPDRRAVPPLVGSTVAAAQQALASVGLRSGTVTLRYDPAPNGVVIASDPGAGARLRPATAVNLVVSHGLEQLPVPDVRNKPKGEAVSILNAAGFKAALTQVFSDNVPAGTVADQSPNSGLASRDSTVSLSVSKGPELVPVPDVTGMNRDAAVAQLTALGLQTQVITPFGFGSTVHAQSPSGGAKVRKGTTVRLLVY